ncbi:MAG: LysM peptidoglycan-binding domain-containing protein [Akkermansia sp.]
MRCSSLLLLSSPAVVLLGLSSCRIANGRMDFSPVEERLSEVRSDDVVVDRGTGNISSAPLIPAAPAPAPPLASAPAAASPASAPAAPAPAPVARAASAPAASAPAAPAPAVRKPSPPAAASGSYTVRAGDTLYAIARRHACSPDALIRANALDPAKPLRIGQQLRLPAGGRAAVAQAPARPAPARSAAPPHAGRTHTVQSGDTLNRIAKHYGLTPAALMQANRISPADAHRLRIGTILTIPAK